MPTGTELATSANEVLISLLPAAERMGVRFADLGPNYAEATVPAEGNGNHFGVIYAGVIFTVAEVLGGGLHTGMQIGMSHYPLVKGVTIEFLKPGTTDLRARAELSDDEVARLHAAVAEGGKVDFELVAEVTDANGVVVARTRGDYQFRPF
jgi:acyl-coenzyme A thioesterase PaaI-like protein